MNPWARLIHVGRINSVGIVPIKVEQPIVVHQLAEKNPGTSVAKRALEKAVTEGAGDGKTSAIVALLEMADQDDDPAKPQKDAR